VITRYTGGYLGGKALMITSLGFPSFAVRWGEEGPADLSPSFSALCTV
jgi:hypothetical protein